MLKRYMVIVIAMIALLSNACGPAASSSPSGGTAPNAGSAAPRALKTLTIAQEQEPADIDGFVTLVRPGGSGSIKDVAHNHLTYKVRDGDIQPELAAELPSIERGTWRVNPDGSMDVTWKLRPNIKWHDGTPFTSADMLFSFGVIKNPGLPPTAAAGTIRGMESALAPDDLTFVVHWSQVDATAPEALGLTPWPRHLLEDVYQTDTDAFVNSSRFRSDFIGLGPYRLVAWELGSHVELARFDDYYRGRPPLDTVVIRFIQDSNTLIANLLSGAVDVTIRPQMELAAAIEVKDRWGKAGNQAWIEPSGRVHYGEAQQRLDVAKPRNGLTDPLVRRAFSMATDRQSLSDAFTQGFAPLADSYVAADDPLRPEVERFIAKYPFDLAGASRLMAEAGWTKGPDGILVHRDTGEPFEGEVWTSPESNQKQESTILAGQWSALGARLGSYVIPVARLNDRELAAHSPLFTVTAGQMPSTWYTPDRLHSRFMASAANSWGGRNKFGYSNPKVDDLLDQLQVTIDPRARVDLHQKLVEEETRDVAFLPIYWEVIPVFMAKGITPSNHRPFTYGEFVAWTRE